MLYSFSGVDRQGRRKAGSIDASGPREARSRLRAEGVFVTEMAEEAAPGKKAPAGRLFRKRVPQKEFTSLVRQLASLLTAGIPLMETLSAAQKQSASPLLKKVVQRLMDSVRQGESLADAMEKETDVFDRLTVSMVRAGEAGGNLDSVLTRIADYKESSLRMENSLRSATVYPVLMALIGTGVVIFLLAYVVPKITVIFEDMGQVLPLSTKILIFVTDMVVEYGFVLGAALCISLMLFQKFLWTKRGRRMADTVAVKAPVLGPVVRSAILARWSHTNSVLLQAGVPLLQTLSLSREVTQNILYSEALDAAMERIREGGGIAESLERSGLFPPVALQMVAAGEKSGQAAELLARVSADQAAELENRLSVLMALVHPLLIMIMGLIVGFIVMAILLPIFEISQLVG